MTSRAFVLVALFLSACGASTEAPLAARDSGNDPSDAGDTHASHHVGSTDAGNDASASDAGAVDVGLADAGAVEGSGPFLVLFDNTKGEQAGAADWVAFSGNRFPSPAHPATETEWRGGMSSWAYELHRTGRYEIEELPPRARITFGDGANAQDLSRYRVFIVPEPNNRFTETESEAIVAARQTKFDDVRFSNASERNSDAHPPAQGLTGWRANAATKACPAGRRPKSPRRREERTSRHPRPARRARLRKKRPTEEEVSAEAELRPKEHLFDYVTTKT